MRTGDDGVVYVSDDDAATLRQVAAEFGLDVAGAVAVLELTPEDHDPDVLLRPRVAVLYRLVLANAQGGVRGG